MIISKAAICCIIDNYRVKSFIFHTTGESDPILRQLRLSRAHLRKNAYVEIFLRTLHQIVQMQR